MSRRRTWSLALCGTALACALAACTVSLPGGVIGGIVALLLAGGLFFGAGFSQSGCDSSKTQPCLSIEADLGPCLSPPARDAGDAYIGPCLSPPARDAGDAYIGPCLDPLPPDAGDAYIGPCLDPLPPDAGDAYVGPCLSPPAHDAGDAYIGPCLEPPLPDAAGDAPLGPCLSIAPADAGTEAPVGPCLSPPAHPLDAGHAAAAPPASASTPALQLERRALLAALEQDNRLPADVLARLKQRGDG